MRKQERRRVLPGWGRLFRPAHPDLKTKRTETAVQPKSPLPPQSLRPVPDWRRAGNIQGDRLVWISPPAIRQPDQEPTLRAPRPRGGSSRPHPEAVRPREPAGSSGPQPPRSAVGASGGWVLPKRRRGLLRREARFGQRDRRSKTREPYEYPALVRLSPGLERPRLVRDGCPFRKPLRRSCALQGRLGRFPRGSPP